jgi:uncharacterized protein DUF4129
MSAPLGRTQGILLVLIVVAVCAGGAYGAPAHPTSEPQEITAAAFADAVVQLHSAVQKLGGDSAAAQRLGASLPTEWIVGERRMEVDAGALRGLLEEYANRPAHRKAVDAELSARLEELEDLAAVLRGPEAGAQTADSARERLTQILSRREFTSAVSWKQILMEKLARWLAKHVGSWFHFLPVHGTSGRVLLWTLVIVLVGGAALWLVRAFSGGGIESLRTGPGPPAGVTWQDWARAGLAASRDGRFREAVHALYWAGVYRLEELNVWSLDRARTPREYLRLLAAQAPERAVIGLAAAVTPEQREALERLTRAFELTWYGYRKAGEEDFQSAAAQLEVFGCRLQ